MAGPMHRIRTACALIGILIMCACSKEPPANLIVTGGRIYTMDARQPVVEAVAIRDGVIVSAGSAGTVNRLKGPGTAMLDLEGRTAIPGLIDSHAHLLGLGRALAELDLVGTKSPREVLDLVIAAKASVPAGQWISGRGWDQNDWEKKEFPTWRDLEGTAENPLYLRRVDGHALWVNKAALDLCGITRETPDTSGGRIIRDARGEPTGVFVDNAIELVKRKKPADTREDERAWAALAMRECNRFGLTGVHDAGIDSLDMAVYRELLGQGALTLRIYAMLDGEKPDLLARWFASGPFEDPTHHLTIRAVKLYADGALGSRGAALLAPYTDAPGETGLLVRPPEDLSQIAHGAVEHGFQVCTHAIGDRGVRVVLDTYERVLKELPGADRRLRVEHAQVVSPDDIPRFAALGVIPAMQPTHATSDMYWAEDRLGPERIKGAYAWRSFLDQGSRVPCGSDFPVERPNPFLGIYAAVTRQDLEGNPPGGWYPEQKMTIEEAVRGFTADAAYAGFAEASLGRLQPGMLADMIVLDRDIFTIPPREIPGTQVIYTMVGGGIVYKKEEPR
jgi:predicted amidohydrolase YtcJ